MTIPLADEYYLKSLKIISKVFGEINSNVAVSYSGLGILYHAIGNMPKTEEYYLKSLKIYVKLFGENHLTVANFFL